MLAVQVPYRLGHLVRHAPPSPVPPKQPLLRARRLDQQRGVQVQACGAGGAETAVSRSGRCRGDSRLDQLRRCQAAGQAPLRSPSQYSSSTMPLAPDRVTPMSCTMLGWRSCCRRDASVTNASCSGCEPAATSWYTFAATTSPPSMHLYTVALRGSQGEHTHGAAISPAAACVARCGAQHVPEPKRRLHQPQRPSPSLTWRRCLSPAACRWATAGSGRPKARPPTPAGAAAGPCC